MTKNVLVDSFEGVSQNYLGHRRHFAGEMHNMIPRPAIKPNLNTIINKLIPIS